MTFLFRPKLPLLILLGLFVALSGYAQSRDAKRAKRDGDDHFEDYEYHRAIDYYKKAIKDPEYKRSPGVNLRLGLSYLHSKQHNEAPKAAKYLKRSLELNPNQPVGIYMALGEALHSSHQFEEAVEYFQRFIQKAQDQPRQVAIAEQAIEQCRFGAKAVADSINATITNLGPPINTKYPEYVPVITADESEMIFTSRRPGSVGGDMAPDGFHYEDLYIAYKQSDGEWSKPQNLGKPVNSKTHDAAIALSPDGSRLYLYDDKHEDIMVSKREGNKYGRPDDDPLKKNINTKDYAELHASVTADLRTLYFCSDREGGYGGFDIWKSTWNQDKERWGEPTNLGPKINTKYDEESPFIHADGVTLYFSSRGHKEKNMGGYDIFRTQVDEDGNVASKIYNLGYPINTAEDDIYFVLSADNRHGYYSSEKTGGQGEKDIYLISMPRAKTVAQASMKKEQDMTPAEPGGMETMEMEEVQTQKVRNPITVLKGTVVDELTKKPLGSDVVIVDNETNEVEAELNSNNETGKFLCVLKSGKNYAIRVEKEEYLFHSENFDIPDSSDYQEVEKKIELKKASIGKSVVLRNIFFDFDKSTLRPESKNELERLLKLMNENPDLKIEIGGHTDARGSDEYNQKLSERRAGAVVDYLMDNGISGDRLEYKGYGESKPIATNETDEGRQLNRRTEFTILAN